jgi:hypothetical protein
MSKIDYQDVINGKGKLIAIAFNKRPIPGGTGEYVSLAVTYEINGVRTSPKFKVPQCQLVKFMMENGKCTGRVNWDTSDPQVAKFIAEKSRTQIKVWVKGSDGKLTSKNGKTYYKALSEGVFKDAPNDEAEDVKAYEKGDLMEVEDEKETDDDETWYLVAVGGQSGFFETMNQTIAELLVGDKRSGFSDKKVDEVLAMIKKPVYWPVDENGEIIKGKQPSMYQKYTYFRAKDGKPERYVNMRVPGQDKPLDLDTIMKSSLTLYSSVMLLTNIYIGAGKIIPQYYVTDTIVVDISEIKMPNALESELEEISADEELLKKLNKQFKESKKFEVPSPRVEEAQAAPAPDSNGAEVEEDGDETTFDDLISNEPKKSKAVENIEPTMEEDIEIPGLPDV